MPPTVFAESKFERMRINLTRDNLLSAAYAFGQFLELPRHELARLRFVSGKENDTPEGYSDKHDAKTGDLKRYFHFSLPILRKRSLQSLHLRSPVARAFFGRAYVLHQRATVTAYRFVKIYMPSFLDELFVVGTDGFIAPRLATLRCLSYEMPVAREHYDKSFITVQIGDSGPGLRVGCCQAAMTPIVYEERRATVFPGLQYHDRFGIAPAWHEVVPTPKRSRYYKDERWAFVFFLSLPGALIADKERTHINACDMH